MALQSMAQMFHQYVGKDALLTVMSAPARVTRVKGERKDVAAQIGIQVPVTITDVRHAFNRAEVLVQPVSGSGSAWVVVEKIKMLDREGATDAKSQLP